MKLVIIGNGIAGTTVARLVAERDPSTQIAIYTEESYLYYPRPRLIDVIAGEIEEQAMPQYTNEWYQKRGIQVHLEHRVTGIEPAEHHITLSDGSVVAYDRLVLANGASNFIPPFKGADLEGVYTLRTLQDALTLRARSKAAQHVVILGGGLLGLDMAMALKVNCSRVTVVEVMPRLLPRQLDEQGAQVLTNLFINRGVQIITSDSCVQVNGSGQSHEVLLKSGRILNADLVAVSAGIRPNIGLAQAAGVVCERGIVVDDHLRTSVPDIYALGDVAEFNKRVWGIIPVALAQGKIAAASICGDDSVKYTDVVPSTTLKVTGIDLTSVGEVNPEGSGYTELRRQDDAAGTYKKIVLRNGFVVGAILLGDRINIRSVNMLIDKKVNVTGYEDQLFDANLSIASVS